MSTLLPVIARLILAAALVAVSAARAASDAGAAPPSGACATPATQPLAWWFGHWDVYAGGKLDGHNFIESTLQGCAVLEHWDDVSGFKGESLFYFEPHAHLWKQIWITDHAQSAGGLKEKSLVYADADSVRFQGTVWVTPERMVLDRTTLHRVGVDQVSQVIEYSKDGGSTWTKSYDAIYKRTAATGGN